MNYYRIRIHTASEAEEALSSFLWDLGAEGVEIFNPEDFSELQTGEILWDYMDADLEQQFKNKDTIISVYFSEELFQNTAVLEELVLRIENELRRLSEYVSVGEARIETDLMNDQDWLNAWKKYYKPFVIGERVQIVPSWMADEGDKSEKLVNLVLDPGAAFGTGMHETTSFCIEFLQDYLREGDKVLDIGTGSGILGIAAAKLGAATVFGTDLDAMAVDVARENIALNGVSDKFRVECGDLLSMFTPEEYKADLVLANIVSDIIMRLSPTAYSFLRDGGTFICSGILRERADEVQSALERDGFVLLGKKERGSWAAFAFQKEA